jgi:hypothetical protein
MILGVHFNLFPDPRNKRTVVMSTSRCDIKKRKAVSTTAARTSGSPSLAVPCNKFIPSRAAHCRCDVKERRITASHSLTARSAANISGGETEIYLNEFSPVQVSENWLSRSFRALLSEFTGRSGLRDAYIPQNATFRFDLDRHRSLLRGDSHAVPSSPVDRAHGERSLFVGGVREV